MPDLNQLPDLPSSTTAERRKEKPKGYSAPDTFPEAANSPVRKVHAVMQGKGGVGKTYIASLIAQYLIEQGEPVVCLDTDMVNATFRDLKALKVEPVDLFKPNSDEIDVNAMDGMVERFVTEDTNFVVDNGATSFVPLSRYFVQDGIAETLEAAGRKLVIHSVIAGGQEMLQTGKGFDSIANQFPASADIVLWLNEHHGAIGNAGAEFETTPLYHAHKNRLLGIVRLPRLHQPTFGANVADMLARSLTFTEADASPDFFIVAKQRLRQVKRPIFDQLSAVV